MQEQKIENVLDSELDILKIKNHKLELEIKKLTQEKEVMLDDLKVKYDDFDWSVIWQDEVKSNLPIASIILGVLQIITMVIIFMK